jgi:hypothetical protein
MATIITLDIKQDLSPDQPYQRLQFALDVLCKVIDRLAS